MTADQTAEPQVPWRQRTITMTYGQALTAFITFQIVGAILDVLMWSLK